MEERDDRDYMDEAGQGTDLGREDSHIRRYFAFSADMVERWSGYQDVTLTVEVQSGGTWVEKETQIDPEISEEEFFERAQAWLPYRGQPACRLRAYPVDNDGVALVDKSRNAIAKTIPYDHSTLRRVREQAGVTSGTPSDRSDDILRETMRQRDAEMRRREESLAAKEAELARQREETERMRLELLGREKDQEFQQASRLLDRSDEQNARSLHMAQQLADAQVGMIKEQATGGIQVITQMMQRQQEEERRRAEAERERLDRMDREREKEREERRLREERREREEREAKEEREARREREEREYRERRDREEREFKAEQQRLAQEREERKERLEREEWERRERREREDREARERREMEAEQRRQEHEARMASLQQQAFQLQMDALRQKAESASTDSSLGIFGKLLGMIGEDPGSVLKRFLKPDDSEEGAQLADMIEALSPVLQSTITGFFGWMQSRAQPGQPAPQWPAAAPAPLSLPSLAPVPMPPVTPETLPVQTVPTQETTPAAPAEPEASDESPLPLEEMRDARASISACIEKLRTGGSEEDVAALVTKPAAALFAAWGVARCVQDQDGPVDLVSKLKFHLENKGIPCKP